MARTDAALLLAARTDPGAFRELYERYAEPLHGFMSVRRRRLERSLPAGTLSLAGTEPTCTVVREDVEFDCTLARAPLALLPRPGGGAPAHHRRGLPRRVRAVAGRRMTVGVPPSR